MCLLAEMPVFEDLFGRSDPEIGARVLVCEDEGLTALRLRRVLMALGYKVVGTARNGEEAVRLAAELRPDVILMDVNMPVLDGIEATRRIIEERPTPVLMLTAYSERELVARAAEAGASGYLVKPLVNEQLHPAIVVARARFAQLQQERDVAGELARSYLSQMPRIPGFESASRYEPAVKAARVGGDFFDVVPIDDQRTGLVIGDVCGSGLAVVGYTAMARHMLRAYCVEDPAPAEVVRRLNRAFYDQMTEETPYLTLVYGVLDAGTPSFTYCAAGHPAPVLYEPGRQECRELSATGGIVGAVRGMEYAQESAALPPGAVLALFTDGIVEAQGAEGPMGSDGVCAVVRKHAAAPVNVIVDAILDRARQCAGGTLRDDAVVLVVRHE